MQILMFVGSRCNYKVRIVHERLRLEEAAERMDEGKRGGGWRGGHTAVGATNGSHELLL